MEIILFVYFRACEKQETISYVKRFNDTNKTTVLKKCWLSLQSSISEEDTIILVHDAVSEDTLTWLKGTSKTKQLTLVPVPEHDWSYHLHTVVLIDILEEFCTKFPTELHYIVEDDYLHVPDALQVMKNTLALWPNFSVSYDYPDRYIKPIPCHVIVGKDRHWRTVESSTMTVAAIGRRWLDVMPELKSIASTSNDKIFEHIYKQIPCISPMPGLASHMTDYHQTPLVDWDNIWNSINV
jgi:hypothetical protein